MAEMHTELLPGKPLNHVNQLKAIERVWREMHRLSCTPSIFLSFDFVMLWYDCFAEPEQVRVYPIFDGASLIGFLPLVARPKGPIRMLSSLTNDHCLHSGPLVAAGQEDAFARHCMDALLLNRTDWDVLQYYCDHSLPNVLSFKEASGSGVPMRERQEPTYTILLPRTFEEYMQQLSPQMRKNARKEMNRLIKTTQHRFLHYTGDAAAAAWSTFLSIEGSGWKGSAGTSILSLPTNYQQYYKRLIELLRDSGRLHLYFLEVGGQPIAGIFGYEDQGVFHGCKSGYREEFASLSPSNLLMLHVFDDVICHFHGVKRINLFPWGHGYKHRYINQEAYFSETFMFSPTIRGHGLYWLSLCKDMMKQIPGVGKAAAALKQRLKWPTTL